MAVGFLFTWTQPQVKLLKTDMFKRAGSVTNIVEKGTFGAEGYSKYVPKKRKR